MMKILMILLGLVICGCASQPTELTQEARDLHVFFEEPKIDYENLGRIDATSRARHAMDTIEKILSRAAELGANAVIIHSVRNKGTVAGGGDAFGTGGGGGFSVYQVQATAIRYIK